MIKAKGYKNITIAFIARKFNIIARFQQQLLLGLIYLGKREGKTETGMTPAACSLCVCVLWLRSSLVFLFVCANTHYNAAVMQVTRL